MTLPQTPPNVPADFPRLAPTASLSGVQAKLAVRRDTASGTYYSGLSTIEVEERHAVCEDIAQQLIAKCLTNRATKYRHLSEEQILLQLLALLLKTDWGNPPKKCGGSSVAQLQRWIGLCQWKG